jgi:Ala-tRNA(Pro) deacylase
MDKNTLYELLTQSGIEYNIYDHEPLYTVEDSKNLRGTITGAHSKNLFLRDQKKNFFLISL